MEGLEVEDFAFHTAYEQNPWWMIDLELTERIESIHIVNRGWDKYQDRLKNVLIHLSIGGHNWQWVKNSCFNWVNGLNELEVEIGSSSRARYIKISLNANTALALKCVKIYRRKINGLVIATRPDALGLRLGAMINGLYLTDKFNLKFGFNWLENHDCKQFETQDLSKVQKTPMLAVEKMFDEEFLKEYLYDNASLGYGNYLGKIDLLKDYTYLFKTKFGLYSSVVLDFSKDDVYINYLKQCSQCYKKIKFSSHFEKIKGMVQNISEKYPDFIAMHLRGGDVVYSETRLCPRTWAKSRHFPDEIAIDIIENNFKNENVIIFGHDLKSNEKLAKYCQNKCKNIVCSYEFIDKNLSDMEKVFFDINLISIAKIVYSTGGSAFQKTASKIGGKDTLLSFYNLYSKEEMSNIILKNINILDLDNFQKAYSWFRLLEISYFDFKDFEKSLKYTNKTLEYDPSNGFFRLMILSILIDSGKILEANNYLKNEFKNNKDSIIFAVFGPWYRYWWSRSLYDEMFNKYHKYADKKYPYIAYMSAKAYEFKKDKMSALKSCKIALSADSKNIYFCELFCSLSSNGTVGNLNKNKQKKHEKKDELFLSAKTRIQNQLTYKLGKAIIENSKSLWGYIRLPYVLSYIAESHANELKEREKKGEKLLKIETLYDYKEALKYKEHLSYKLG